MRPTHLDAFVEWNARARDGAVKWRDTLAAQGRSFAATVVTAYFALPRAKHPHDWFLKQSQDGMMGLCTPMVLFSNLPSVERHREIAVRANPACDAPTLFVLTPLNVTMTHRRFFDAIAARMDRELQKDIHTPDMLVVWHSKVELVDLVARLNPFHSDRFIWLDFASLRGAELDRHRAQVWPDPHLVRQRLGSTSGRITMMGLRNYYPPCGGNHLAWFAQDGREKRLGAGGLPTPPPEPHFENLLHVPEFWKGICHVVGCFLVGGLWGGEPLGVSRLRVAYYDALDEYIRDDRADYDFADQHVFLSLFCTRPDLIEVIDPPTSSWFWLFDLVATTSRAPTHPPSDSPTSASPSSS